MTFGYKGGTKTFALGDIKVRIWHECSWRERRTAPSGPGASDLGQLGNGRQGNTRSATEQIYQTVPIQAPLARAGAAVTGPRNLLHRERLLVDGQARTADAYLHEGNNHFKLRDLAAELDFAVAWDSGAGAVSIDTTRGYSA